MKHFLLILIIATLGCVSASAQQCWQQTSATTMVAITCPVSPTPTPLPTPQPSTGLPANWIIAPTNAPYNAGGSLGICASGVPCYYQVEDNHASAYFNLIGQSPNGAEIGVASTKVGVNDLMGSFNFSWLSPSPGVGDTRTATIASYIDGAVNSGNLMFGVRLKGNSVQPDYVAKLNSSGDWSLGATTIAGARLNVIGHTTITDPTIGATQNWYDRNGNQLATFRDDGKFYLRRPAKGIIMTSPSGACFEITIADTGTLTTKPASPCPP